MVLNSALLLLMRSLSAAMLMLVQKRYFVLFMAGDVALYLLQKVFRGDFYYWLPVDGALGLIASLVARVMTKTITDFTGLIQFRHPYELGGLYWTGNMVMALLASFASVWIYTTSGDKEVTEGEAWTMVGCMGGGWVITFGLFLLLMKKGYRRTFFSAKTGKQQAISNYVDAQDEAVRAAVFSRNEKMWRPIRDEVKGWVLSNWYRWVEEKPSWFTEAWVNKVPDDFIPEDEDKVKLKEIRKSTRRRSSAGAALDVARVHPIL